MSNLMKKAITVFEKETKGKGLEIRNVYFLEGNNEKGVFLIECNLLILNKYYSVTINVCKTSKDYAISELKEC